MNKRLHWGEQAKARLVSVSKSETNTVCERDTVTLSYGDVMLVRIIASLRAGVNRSIGTKDVKRGPQDGFYTDLLGVAGELAFAKRFNLFPDLTFSPRSGGHDFVMRNGHTADVKTTDRGDGRLLVTPKKRGDPSDVYFLLVGEVPLFKIMGYAKAKQVFDDGNLTNFGRGTCYALTQDQLQQDTRLLEEYT